MIRNIKNKQILISLLFLLILILPISIACTDSDGGKNYKTQGTVKNAYGTTWIDNCIDSTKLREYFCNPDDTIGIETYSCESGNKCENGACVISVSAGSTITSPCTANLKYDFFCANMNLKYKQCNSDGTGYVEQTTDCTITDRYCGISPTSGNSYCGGYEDVGFMVGGNLIDLENVPTNNICSSGMNRCSDGTCQTDCQEKITTTTDSHPIKNEDKKDYSPYIIIGLFILLGLIIAAFVLRKK